MPTPPKPGEEPRDESELYRYHLRRLITWYLEALDPLPDDAEVASPAKPPEPDRTGDAVRFERALSETVSALDARDRLRLGCYYAQELTLAQTGRVLRESEATASRQLARTRRAIREDVERRLRAEGLDEAHIAQCFAEVADDVGTLDLSKMLGETARKKTEPDRSI